MELRRSSGSGRVAAVVVGLALVAGLFAVGSRASATFPGTNGVIAYTNAAPGDVFTISEGGGVPTQITTGGGFIRGN